MAPPDRGRPQTAPIRTQAAPGLTPETVFPWAVEVREIAPGQRPLHWAPLSEVIRRRAELPDGHLRVVSLRAAHALRGTAGGARVA